MSKPAITGYRVLQQAEIDSVNLLKDEGERVRAVLDVVRAKAATYGFEIDERWMSIAETHFQQGFMAAARAITKPTSFA
jgi:hypothetical protein